MIRQKSTFFRQLVSAVVVISIFHSTLIHAQYAGPIPVANATCFKEDAVATALLQGIEWYLGLRGYASLNWAQRDQVIATQRGTVFADREFIAAHALADSEFDQIILIQFGMGLGECERVLPPFFSELETHLHVDLSGEIKRACEIAKRLVGIMKRLRGIEKPLYTSNTPYFRCKQLLHWLNSNLKTLDADILDPDIDMSEQINRECEYLKSSWALWPPSLAEAAVAIDLFGAALALARNDGAFVLEPLFGAVHAAIEESFPDLVPPKMASFLARQFVARSLGKIAAGVVSNQPFDTASFVKRMTVLAFWEWLVERADFGEVLVQFYMLPFGVWAAGFMVQALAIDLKNSLTNARLTIPTQETILRFSGIALASLCLATVDWGMKRLLLGARGV